MDGRPPRHWECHASTAALCQLRASATCSSPMRSAPAKSTIVRATFSVVSAGVAAGPSSSFPARGSAPPLPTPIHRPELPRPACPGSTSLTAAPVPLAPEAPGRAPLPWALPRSFPGPADFASSRRRYPGARRWSTRCANGIAPLVPGCTTGFLPSRCTPRTGGGSSPRRAGISPITPLARPCPLQQCEQARERHLRPSCATVHPPPCGCRASEREPDCDLVTDQSHRLGPTGPAPHGALPDAHCLVPPQPSRAGSDHAGISGGLGAGIQAEPSMVRPGGSRWVIWSAFP